MTEKKYNFTKGKSFRFISSGTKITITKGSRDLVMGMLKTDHEKYTEISCDFLKRQIDFGFVNPL